MPDIGKGRLAFTLASDPIDGPSREVTLCLSRHEVKWRWRTLREIPTEPTSGFEPLTPSLRVKCSTS
jgi:hypothetical protein